VCTARVMKYLLLSAYNSWFVQFILWVYILLL
jgi:hypothetical protein